MDSTSLDTGVPEEPPPIAEPDYTKANQLPFATLCRRLEVLWKQRTSSKKPSRDELLEYLLSPKLHETLAGGSPFPLFRLIMPEIDTSRPHSGMKEKTIATAWSEALGFNKGTTPYLKLTNYTDPTIAGMTAAGDLSVALKEVLEERFPYTPSKLTVGQINDLLDELASIRKKNSNEAQVTQHNWRSSSGQKKNKAKKGISKKEQQVEWVRKLIRHELSPVEHKWIARILLQKLEIGVGSMSILKYYSPWAEEVHSANNSLKRLCATLSDPAWIQRRKEQEERDKLLMQEDNKQNHMPRSKAQASLGNTIAPMLAQRTSFSDALSDITRRHREYAKNLSSDASGASSLALRLPTFVCEVKLDGERIVAHVKRGVVTLQTRNSKWYSELYSPALGPPLRRAISRYDVDVILDGEVVAWDDGKKETIPFGINRTVARYRRDYLERHGEIDPRDLNLHEHDEDMTVMRAASDWSKSSTMDSEHEEGAECWLKYVVFDILYVGGPGAKDLISQCVSKHTEFQVGSIVNLDAFERKKILYRLIEPQENEIVIVPSLVVRSNGTSVNAANYFSATDPTTDSGHPSSTVDSIECALRGDVPNLADIDKQLCDGRSDAELNRRRAAAMEHFYGEIVERQCLEGLVFKDLASPYVLGLPSRSLGYWWKLKPDYNEGGHAADLDVIVIGACYATGLGRAGLLNQFLVGCVDSENPGKYMTLSKVNGGGTAREKMDKLLKKTGFTAGSSTEQLSYGKWFKETDHGRSLPDFLSKRSFQRSRRGDNDGWKCSRDMYPDLWIHPDESVVLTMNAGEIVASDAFSAGITLRFPRISKVRLGDDEKKAEESESIDELHRLYDERSQQATANEGTGFDTGSPLKRRRNANNRFLTLEELTQKKKKTANRKKAPAEFLKWRMPQVEKVKSTALQGLTFTVFEGTFVLDEDTLDAEEAKEQQRYDEAGTVRCREDVMKFIIEHSGKCILTVGTETNYVLGGRVDDPRVENHHRGMMAAGLETGRSSKTRVNLQRILQTGGVLKWTFVYSLIYRWKNEQKRVVGVGSESGSELPTPEGTIISTSPSLLNPKRHDFLVLSPTAEQALGLTEDAFGIDLNKNISMVDFKRGFQEVRYNRKRRREEEMDMSRAKILERLDVASEVSPNVLPWQYAAFEELEPNERWVMAGKHQSMWPYRSSHAGHSSESNDKPQILYPHIFTSRFGLSDHSEALSEVLSGIKSSRWDDVSPELERSGVTSSLALSRAMGFQITCHLHSGVTHILCDNIPDGNSVVWKGDRDLEAFFKEEDAKCLLQRLTTLHGAPLDTDHPSHSVTLITPRWIHDEWDTSH